MPSSIGSPQALAPTICSLLLQEAGLTKAVTPGGPTTPSLASYLPLERGWASVSVTNPLAINPGNSVTWPRPSGLSLGPSKGPASSPGQELGSCWAEFTCCTHALDKDKDRAKSRLCQEANAWHSLVRVKDASAGLLGTQRTRDSRAWAPLLSTSCFPDISLPTGINRYEKTTRQANQHSFFFLDID